MDVLLVYERKGFLYACIHSGFVFPCTVALQECTLRGQLSNSQPLSVQM